MRRGTSALVAAVVAALCEISCGCIEVEAGTAAAAARTLPRHPAAFLSAPAVLPGQPSAPLRCPTARRAPTPPLAGRRRQPALIDTRMSAYSSSHTLSAKDLAAGPPVIDMGPLFSMDTAVEKQEVIDKIAKAAAQWGFFQVRARLLAGGRACWPMDACSCVRRLVCCLVWLQCVFPEHRNADKKSTCSWEQVVGHGVPDSDIDAFDQAVRRFFAREKGYKYKIKRTAFNSRGYFDDELTKQTRDWKEAIDIGAQDGDLNGRSAVDGYNQWPEDDALFRSDVERYFGHMQSLSRTLCGALALGLGEDQHFFDPLFEKHTSYLRINHYPPCPNPVGSDFPLRSPNSETEGYLAINRHTDAGILTVLRQKHDEPHSLQVFISDDVDKDHESREGQWVCVVPQPGAFTINIADMMQVAFPFFFFLV